MQNKSSIKNLNRAALIEFLRGIGESQFRAEQIHRQLYVQRAESFSDMHILPLTLRDKLAEHFLIDSLVCQKIQHSSDGSAKFLFRLNDGNEIESVFIPEKRSSRITLCISSQAGCALGCKFCATGTMGLKRNLEIGEILDQVLMVEKEMKEKVSNIVLMGMGEPLQNFENVVDAIKIMTDQDINIISASKITLSTSGVVPKIYELADKKLKIKLAISLHATTNGVREKIVPIASKWNLSDLGDAIEYYYKQNKKPITYEYIVFDGLNDSNEDVKRLTKFTRRVRSKINLIPFHDISFALPEKVSLKLRPSSKDNMLNFAERLRKAGCNVFIRDSIGEDINAACGQLALSERGQTK